MSWDCSRLSDWEEDISGHDAATWTLISMMRDNLRVPFEELLKPDMRLSFELIWLWGVFVSMYLKCDLTYPEDKWQAIQGLAAVVSDS
jgi:hypothetical protein